MLYFDSKNVKMYIRSRDMKKIVDYIYNNYTN